MNAIGLGEEIGAWPSFCELLMDRYTILDGYGLYNYDLDMDRLYNQLLKYKSREFLDNERLIFSLHDTDFFYLDSKIGFTVYNWINLLLKLDISLGHCILLTNHHGLKKEIEQLCLSYKQEFPVVVNENNFVFTTDLKDTNDKIPTFNLDDMQYHFCSLNNRRRDHRVYTRCYIESVPEIKNKTLLSWHNALVPDHIAEFENNPKSISSDTQYVSLTPFVRSNDKIIISDSKLQNLYNNYFSCLSEKYVNPLINSVPYTSQDPCEFFKYTFINLTSESVFNYPYPYLTEKTFFSICHLRPFILMGAPNSLGYLKSIGFKTFDKWINEEYDQIYDAEQRLLNIFNLMNTISKWPLEQCRDVYRDMKQVLDHNYNHYVTYFCDKLLHQNQLLL